LKLKELTTESDAREEKAQTYDRRAARLERSPVIEERSGGARYRALAAATRAGATDVDGPVWRPWEGEPSARWIENHRRVQAFIAAWALDNKVDVPECFACGGRYCGPAA